MMNGVLWYVFTQNNIYMQINKTKLSIVIFIFFHLPWIAMIAMNKLKRENMLSFGVFLKKCVVH